MFEIDTLENEPLSIKEANREPEEDYSEYLETEDSLGSLGELFDLGYRKNKRLVNLYACIYSCE